MTFTQAGVRAGFILAQENVNSSVGIIRVSAYNDETWFITTRVSIAGKGGIMAVLFKEFNRPAFSGNADELKRKVVKFCNTDIKGFRVISISEAKGITDDFYRITVWYDDDSERFEQLMAETHIQDAIE